MIHIETENRSGVAFPAEEAGSFSRDVLKAEAIEAGELGLWFVPPPEIRALKREHLGIDEITDVLSFPIDGDETLPADVPRALGDVFLCPQALESSWRAPLAHGLLHLLGYRHGEAMQRRELELLA